MPADIPGYVTVAELATVTGLTRATIRYHCRTGTIPAEATGNVWLIPTAAAQAFAKSVNGKGLTP